MTTAVEKVRRTERLTVRTTADIKLSIQEIVNDEVRSESDVVNILLSEAIRARA